MAKGDFLFDWTPAPANAGLEVVGAGSVPSQGSDGDLIEWIDPNDISSIWQYDGSLSAWVLQTTFQELWVLEDWSSQSLREDLWTISVEQGNGRSFDGDHCIVNVSGTQEDIIQFHSDGAIHIPPNTEVRCEAQRVGNNGNDWRIHQRILGFFDTDSGASDKGEIRNELRESSGGEIRSRILDCDGSSNSFFYTTPVLTDLYLLEHQLFYGGPYDKTTQNTKLRHRCSAYNITGDQIDHFSVELPGSCAPYIQPGYVLFTLRSQSSDSDPATLELGNIWLRR